MKYIYQIFKFFSFFSAKSVPFRIEFYSDGYELSGAALEAAASLQTDGAKIQYYQVACWIVDQQSSMTAFVTNTLKWKAGLSEFLLSNM